MSRWPKMCARMKSNRLTARSRIGLVACVLNRWVRLSLMPMPSLLPLPSSHVMRSGVEPSSNTSGYSSTRSYGLKARQKAVSAARLQMTNLVTAKRNLMTKLEGIEAKLQMIEATQGKNEFNFDDSALARAKQAVNDLEKRLEVKARVAEIEGRFSDGGLPILEPGRDVVREIDAEFGSPVKGGEVKTGDKSL